MVAFFEPNRATASPSNSGPDLPLEVRGSAGLLSLRGDFSDRAEQEQLRHSVSALRGSGLAELVVDMKGLTYLNAEVVANLIHASQPPHPRSVLNDHGDREQALKVTVLNAAPKVLEKFEMLCLTNPGSPISVLQPRESASYLAELLQSPTQESLKASVVGLIAHSIERSRIEALEPLRFAAADERTLSGPVCSIERSANKITLRPEQSEIREQTVISGQFIYEISTAAEEAKKAPHRLLELDCQNITNSLGADALGALITAQKQLKNSGGALVLINVPEAISRQLELTRLTNFFAAEELRAA